LIVLASIGIDTTKIVQDALSNPSLQQLAENVLSHMLQIQVILQDAVIRSQEFIPRLFSKPVAELSTTQQVNAISAAIEIVVTNGGQPIKTFEITDNFSGKERIYLLTEYWSFLFSGMSDDSKYNLAVALDVAGKKLAEPPENLAESLAKAHNARNNLWPLHRGWTTEKMPPSIASKEEIIAEALDELVNIPPEFFFVRGWALSCLKPLLTDKYPELLPEALSIALTTLDDNNAYKSQTDALSELAPHLITSSSPLLDVLASIQALKDPFFRSRALARIAPYINSEKEKLFNGALNSARSITDFYKKTRALERLIPIFLKEQIDLRRETLSEARKIEDIDNRVRALCRLSMYFPVKEREHILNASLDSVEQMAKLKALQKDATFEAIEEIRSIGISVERDEPLPAFRADQDSFSFQETDLAETLNLVRPYIVNFPNLKMKWERIVHSLQTKWQQEIAQNRLSYRLINYQNCASQPEPELQTTWAVIILSAVAHDLQIQGGKLITLQQLWFDLASNPSEKSLEKLLRHGEADGLTLTQAAANALDVLIDNDCWSEVETLLPLLTSFEQEAIPILYQWREFERISYQVTLLLAEAEGLTSEYVSSLVELLESYDDRLRHRASLVLQCRRNGSFQLASELGQETIQELANKILENISSSPKVSLTIKWGFERIIFDSPEMILNWSEAIVQNSEIAEQAKLILSSLQSITEPVGSVLITELSQNSQSLKLCLLQSFVRLQVKQWNKTDRWQPPKEFWTKLLLLLRELVQHECLSTSIWAIKTMGYYVEEENDIAFLTQILRTNNAEKKAQTLLSLSQVANRKISSIRRRFGVTLSIIYQLLYDGSVESLTENQQEKILEFEIQILEQIASVQNLKNYILSCIDDPNAVVQAAAAEGLLRAGVDSFHLYSILDNNGVRTLKALLNACNFWYMSDAYEQAISDVANFLEQNPNLFEYLLTYLSEQLVDSVTDTFPDFISANLLDSCAAAAVRMPATFANLAEKHQLEPLLIEAATFHNTFTGRRGAITLLSLLRTIKPDIVEALQSTLHDVYDVQNRAIEAASRFSNVGNEFLPKLCKGLYHESSVVSYATARILTVIARNEKITREQRFEIMQALRKAINHPSSRRGVYIMGGSLSLGDDSFRIEYLGRLEELFYEFLSQITGVANSLRRNSRYGKIEISNNVAVRRYAVPYIFQGEESSTEICLGKIHKQCQPIQYQSKVLSSTNGSLPGDLTIVFDKLRDIALENNYAFFDLIDFAIEVSQKTEP